MFLPKRPEVLVESRTSLHTFWTVNTMERRIKTLNNDHYDYTYYRRLSAFHVLFLYDWLFWLASAISFQERENVAKSWPRQNIGNNHWHFPKGMTISSISNKTVYSVLFYQKSSSSSTHTDLYLLPFISTKSTPK